MAKENSSLDFWLKEIVETRNYPLDEIKHSEFMNENHRNVCKAFNFFEHFLVFVSAFSGRVSISAFALLVGVPVGIASSAVELKNCALTAVIKK